MDKFKSKFFEKSPIKEIAKGRAGRLRKRAQRVSERSGETGDYDYTNMKVLKLLDKAKKIENRNFIKDLGFKKGSKRKGSKYGEDARISASYDRPDSDSHEMLHSPLKGAYEQGVDGLAFMGGVISGQDHFAGLQKDIIQGFDNYMEGEGTQAALEQESQDNINAMEKGKNEKEKDFEKRKQRAQEKHDSRYSNTTKGKDGCPEGQYLEFVLGRYQCVDDDGLST